jgi:NAD(P)-dependent dehydrogenase (short-subunit alcohol dehydrogenase family)
VTGAARGIGAEIAVLLARQGASVALIDVDVVGVEATARSLPAGRGLHFAADAADTEAFAEVVAGACAALGGCEVLVNNVGDYRRQGLDGADLAYWRHMMAMNLDHAFAASQAARPWLVRQGGAIVNIGSIKGWTLSGGMVGYVSGKAGLAGLSRALARELGPSGVRVNTLAPGMVATEGNAPYMDPGTVARVLEMQCLKRVAEPMDVAAMALFLASDAGRMITGQEIRIDGGF